jgi:hypothetical protein
MIRSFEYFFEQKDVGTVFEYMALGKDMEKWYRSKYIVDLSNTYEDERLTGFIVKFKVDGIVGCSENEVTKYVYGEEICFRETQLSFRDRQNRPLEISRPHSGMEQRLLFYQTKDGSLVRHQIYFETKGIFNWLSCYFYLFYAAKKEALQAGAELRRYLNGNT